MRYFGKFHSIIKDKEYSVEIITNNSSTGTVDITLGPDAFVTNMDTGASTIYSPVKYTSASIQLVSSDYFFDLYARTPKQNTVKLFDSSNNIIWSGYINCNVYNADYNFVTETWDIECVDKLCVLKNYDYKPFGSVYDGQPAKGFVTFYDIINKCLQTAGFDNSSNWYISTATRIPNKNVLVNNLSVSEQNFFDEDDTAMKLNEVFEEVCKFCGVTAITYKNDVYFIDYDAVKAGNFQFDRYTVGSSSPTTVTLTDTVGHTIAKESYSSTGSSLSLDNVYSKVTVRDSLYTVNSIIPSLFNDDDLVNSHYVSEADQRWNYEEDASCVGDYTVRRGNNNNAKEFFQIRARHYTNKKYEHKYYSNSTGELISNPTPISSMIDAETKLGASFSKFNIGYDEDSSAAAYRNLEYDNFENYLMMPVNYTTYTGMVKLVSKDEFLKPFFMSGKTKLVAHGELTLTDRGTFKTVTGGAAHTGYWPDTGRLISNYTGGSFFKSGVEFETKKQNLVFGISVNIGSTTKSFSIPFYPAGEGNDKIYENKKKHEVFYQGFAIQNTVDYTDKIKEKGYVLDMNFSDSVVIPAKPKISMYGFDNLVNLTQGSGNKQFLSGKVVGCAFMKDFDIVAVDPFEGSDDRVNATDTEYSVEIDADYTTELNAIEFKLCTADGKSLNYSSVAYIDPATGNYQFLDTLNNTALNQNVRSEYMLCYRLVNQYNSPSKKLTINMFDDLIRPWTLITEPYLNNAKFIIDTVSYNYSTDTATVNLVEKK